MGEEGGSSSCFKASFNSGLDTTLTSATSPFLEAVPKKQKVGVSREIFSTINFTFNSNVSNRSH